MINKKKLLCKMLNNHLKKKLYERKQDYFYEDLLCFKMIKYKQRNISLLNKIFSRINKNKTHIHNNYSPSLVKCMSKDLSIKPFWDDNIKKLSDQLFIPTFDNLVTIENPFNTFNYKNWFDVTKQIPLNPIENDLFNYSNEDYEEKDITKCKKVKINFNKEQRKYFNQIIGTYRYYYNRCVSYINNYNPLTRTTFFYIYPDKKTDIEKQKITIVINKKDSVYSNFTARKHLNKNNPEWLLKRFPVHLIDQAIFECCNRIKSCFSNLINNGRPFVLKYKTKKDLVQTINLEKIMIKKINAKKINLFSNFEINNKYLYRNIKLYESYPSNFGDSSISYHKLLKHYFINFNYKEKTTNSGSNKLCSIDQGIRTPFNIFSKDESITIGDNCFKVLLKKCKEIDIITSRMNSKSYYVKKDNITYYYKMNSKRKKNLRKALHRKINKVKNLKTELHNKTIKLLTDTYKCIILPPFNIQEMATGLTSKVSRSMYNLSFYQFKEKLKKKALSKNITVAEYSEPYTSKTCGRCGTINEELGNSKVFNCNNCKLIIDRDNNGARNIMLRNYQFIKK